MWECCWIKCKDWWCASFFKDGNFITHYIIHRQAPLDHSQGCSQAVNSGINMEAVFRMLMLPDMLLWRNKVLEWFKVWVWAALLPLLRPFIPAALSAEQHDSDGDQQDRRCLYEYLTIEMAVKINSVGQNETRWTTVTNEGKLASRCIIIEQDPLKTYKYDLHGLKWIECLYCHCTSTGKWRSPEISLRDRKSNVGVVKDIKKKLQ